MRSTSRALQATVWPTLVLRAFGANSFLDDFSFGHQPGAYISPDFINIPHFTVKGINDFTPQLLSDRVILTPPYPGGKRGSVWAQNPFSRGVEWTAELEFRASGEYHGAGNLQLWYVKESQGREDPKSLYTSPKFDGLVLVVDQYEGHGGSVRGFLNDGTIDFKSHPHLDTLAFGKCDYAYRNRGALTPIVLHHTADHLEVRVDGQACFKTDKIKLPEGYYFGISASSAENPDSFEVHKFAVTSEATKDSNQDIYNAAQHQRQQQQDHAMQKAQHRQAQHHQQTQSGSSTEKSVPKMLEDVLASSIQSQQDQFADLHNRIQIMNNRISDIHEVLERLYRDSEQRANTAIRNIEKVDRTTTDILRDVESKDFKNMMQEIHRALENNREGLSRSIPAVMDDVVRSHKSSLTSFLFIAIAVQIVVTGAYIVYKKRKGGAPKKYL